MLKNLKTRSFFRQTQENIRFARLLFHRRRREGLIAPTYNTKANGRYIKCLVLRKCPVNIERPGKAF